jgi:hypothetical protein
MRLFFIFFFAVELRLYLYSFYDVLGFLVLSYFDYCDDRIYSEAQTVPKGS